MRPAQPSGDVRLVDFWVNREGQRCRNGGRTELQRPLSAGPDEFGAVAEAMPHLVWIADADGTISYLNDRWSEYTGLTLERVRNGAGVAAVVHPDDAGETLARWKAALTAGTNFEIEYRLRRASDGDYRWFLGRASPARDRRGTILGWIGTATDIDEQRRLRDSLAFIVAADGVLAFSRDVPEICRALTDVAAGWFADWCFVVLARDGRIELTSISHRDADQMHGVERYLERYAVLPTDALARVIAENRPELIERVSPEWLAAAARDAEHLALLQRIGARSAMLVPLTTASGETYGAFGAVASDSGRVFTDADLKVGAAVAARAATAIAGAHLLEHERTMTRGLRMAARINQLLLETDHLRGAIERIAETIAEEMADGCAVMRLRNETVRTEFVVHRDPQVALAASRLRGQRTLRPTAERALAYDLREHRTIVYDAQEHRRQVASTWPHLAEALASLDPVTTVILPLSWGTTTYGALVAYFSARPYAADRDLPLLEEAAARISVGIERADTLERERRISTTLQRALLPTLIPQPRGIHLDAVYSPATGEGEIGGDWYDAVELNDGSLVVSVGDVTGRGIQAAAIMSKVRHAMGMTPLHESDPARILDGAEWFLRKRYPEAIVTAFVGVISPDRKTLRYANAGHPPPVLRRGGELSDLEAQGLPIGLRHLGPPAESRSIELQDGDVLLLFTDGLTEWSRSDPDGERCLRAVARSDAMAVSLNSARLVERSCVPDGSPDDVAILTVALGDAPAWWYASEDARVAAHARREFVEYLREAGAADAFVARAELIFGELLGNVVRHAPGPVEIALYRRGDVWTLHVIDSGEDFDPQRDLPNDPLSERGRGLFIVQRLAAAVRVETFAAGNHIIATL